MKKANQVGNWEKTDFFFFYYVTLDHIINSASYFIVTFIGFF